MTDSNQRGASSLEQVAIADLKPFTQNARTHSDRQISQIAGSIEAFGFNNPVLVDHANGIIAGHGRVQAARQLSLKTVPVIRIEHLSDDEKRAYILADNRLAEKAGWDRDILAIELQHLTTSDLTFDVEITGFETAEIDLLIGDEAAGESEGEKQVMPNAYEPALTRTGDVWHLGDHRLCCGNSLDPAAWEAAMGGERARAVFTDPPYNVPVSGHICGLGAVRHREFAMASGEMSRKEFTTFLKHSLDLQRQFSCDGAVLFNCMDWRHVGEMDAAASEAGLSTLNICVWVKSNGGMGSLYRSRHEFVFVFRSGREPHVNNVQLGRYGRYRTNVWEYAGVNSFSRGRMDALEMHPTVKPVALVADAIRDCSCRRDIILDPFGGSGTTLIAAEKTGRNARLIEIDPLYCDATIRRWQKMTGLEARRADTDETFDEAASLKLEKAEEHTDGQ